MYCWMLWLLLCYLARTTETAHPVVLVPGCLASHLEARLNRTETEHFYCTRQSGWYNVWLTIHQIFGPQLYCWADNFNLRFKDGIFSNAPGVEFRVPGFGDTSSVRYIDNLHLVPYFNSLVEGLLKVPGMKDSVSVRAAPFDFRYTPPSTESNEYFIRLKLLIEATYEENSRSRVALVSHSMGSLITSTFLNTVSQEWKDRYIHSWSSLGGVFGGALKLVKALVSHGVIDYIPDFISNRLKFREVARRVMANYFMLPRYPFWSKDEVLLQTPGANYTVENLHQMFGDMDYPTGSDKWKAVRNSSYTGDPGVVTYCFNGRDIKTTSSYFYTDDSHFPDSVPQEMYGDGDGTVPYRSLQICHKWSSTAQVFEYHQEEGEHNKLLSNKDVISQLIEIISHDKRDYSLAGEIKEHDKQDYSLAGEIKEQDKQDYSLAGEIKEQDKQDYSLAGEMKELCTHDLVDAVKGK